MFLELEGRVELLQQKMSAFAPILKGAQWNTHLVEGNQWWPGGHIGGLGARMDAALRVGVDGGLFHELTLPRCVGARRWRLGTDLDLSRRRWARKSRGTRRK